MSKRRGATAPRPAYQPLAQGDGNAGRAVSILLIAALLLRLATFWINFRTYGCHWEYPRFGMSEFLINLEGGAVRRGLLGQLIYKYCAATGKEPGYSVTYLCLAAYLATAFLLIRRTAARRWNWWLLLSPLLLGYTDDIVRKDFMLMLLFMASLWIATKRLRGFSAIAVGLLGASGILLHEAYIFWGVPLCLLAVTARDTSRRRKLLELAASLLPPLLLFAACCLMKGDADTARAIADSWTDLFGEEIVSPVGENSVAATGWETAATMRMHFERNFLTDIYGTPAWTWRIPVALAIYYLITNAFMTLRIHRSSFTERDRTNLGSAVAVATLCLLPMFTVLSCDYSRLWQYVGVTSVAATLWLPRELMERMFPLWLRDGVSRFNRFIDRNIPPGRWIIILLIFILMPAWPGYEAGDSFRQTPAWALLHIFDF